MDQLRVLAFLDILNGISLQARIACDRAAQAAQASAGGDDGSTSQGAHGGPGSTRPNGTSGGDVSTSGDAGSGSTSDGDGDGSTTADQDDRPGAPGKPGSPAAAPILPALTARSNLTLPLATLLGLADRPGAAHGLGPLDPALVRDLAAAAANSADSEWCVTITDGQGVAVAHGCAKPARTKKNQPASRDGPAGWAFTPTDDPGPPGGYGTWTLTLPGGRDFTVRLEPVPVTSCDHRHESRGYQPSDTLRHLVQVRDGTCTFPPCSRHARESDFEHAIPYDKGGRTCACNGSARSRRCHRVKQSKGWTVTQPQPGWHQWTTPAGRTYTQGPMQYPALYQLDSSLSCGRLGTCTRLCRPYGSRMLERLARGWRTIGSVWCPGRPDSSARTGWRRLTGSACRSSCSTRRSTPRRPSGIRFRGCPASPC